MAAVSIFLQSTHNTIARLGPVGIISRIEVRSTAATQMDIHSTDHWATATFNEYPVIHAIRSSPPPPLSARDPTTRWQRDRAMSSFRWVDRDMLRRGAPRLHHHGVIILEGCRNRQKNNRIITRRTPPSET